MCDAATRGIWADAVNSMLLSSTDSVTGTIEELSRLCRCRTMQMQVAIAELQRFSVCNVYQHNGNTTLTNRRLHIQLTTKALRSKAGTISSTNRQHTRQHTSASAYASEGGAGGRKIHSPSSRVLIHELNQKTGKRFLENDEGLSLIDQRLSEDGTTLDGVRLMIDRQIKLWKGSRMEEFLRPSTLFKKEKFYEYYAAREMPISNLDRPNPRNEGAAIGSTDYGTAKPRLQRERESQRLAEETAMARQMAKTQNNQPEAASA